MSCDLKKEEGSFHCTHLGIIFPAHQDLVRFLPEKVFSDIFFDTFKMAPF